MGELIFIPANSAIKSNQICWWKALHSDKSLDLDYPYLLVSAHYDMKQDDKDGSNIWERYEIPDDFWILGDSGGFQAATCGIKIDVKKTLRWQENHCHAGMIPDQPISSYEGKGKKGKKRKKEDWDTFAKAVKITYNQTVDYYNMRDWDVDLDVYNIILGYTTKQMEYSYKKLKSFNDDDGFTGWATGGKPTSDPMLQALIAGFLYSKGQTENLHFLGESGFDVIPVLALAATKFDKVTFDSSTFVRGAMDRGFHIPFNIKSRFYFGEVEVRGDGQHSSTLSRIPCFCPVCSVSTVDDLRKDKLGVRMSLHNLYHFIQYTKFMNVIKDDHSNLMEFTKRFTKRQRTHQAMAFLNDCFEDDFERAYKRHYLKGADNINDWC